LGGARNLKEGGDREGQGQGTWAINFLYVGQMSTLVSCCVHRKDVAGSRGRAPGRVRPLETETLSYWTFNGTCKFACFLIFGIKIIDICAVLQNGV